MSVGPITRLQQTRCQHKILRETLSMVSLCSSVGRSDPHTDKRAAIHVEILDIGTSYRCGIFKYCHMHVHAPRTVYI